MAEDSTQTLAQQVRELSDRLDRLEGLITTLTAQLSAQFLHSDDNGQDPEQENASAYKAYVEANTGRPFGSLEDGESRA